MATSMSEISELFTLAERKIKLIENLGEGLLFPAVNQLRYVSFHLLRAEKISDASLKEEELRKAKNHCQRAIYDAVEVGIIHCLEVIRSFQSDYKTEVIPDIVPEYLEILKKANEAKRFISEISKDSIADHCTNPGDQYKESTIIFEELKNSIDTLEIARTELNKKMRKNRITYFITIISIIVALVGVIVAIIAA